MAISGNENASYQRFEFGSHALPLMLLLFICLWPFFYKNGVQEIDSMEARNLVTASEILENNSWLIPTMNGEIRLAKPPLPTWFAALVSLSVGGTDNRALLRIPSAISAVLLVFFTYGLCWTMSRDKTLAFMAAAILATNILMMKMGHRATWDIFCHTFMLGGLWAFMDGMRNNRGWPVFAIFGTFMGLSFMSKGPVSFFALLLPFVLSYVWIFRTGEFRIKWRLILLAFAICIFISGLWPFYIWTFHHEALLTTVSKESSAWINLHLQPFWYYSKFPVYSGLWLVVTIAALIKPFAEKRVKSIPDYQFFLLWLVLDILLLSVVPEKKLRYLLPAMIPMAMLGGTVLRAVMDNYSKGRPEKGDSMVISLHACFISIIGVFFPSAVFYRVYIAGGKENPGWFILVFAAFFAVVVFSWLFYRKKNVPGLLSLTIVQCCLIAASHWHFYQGVYFTNPDYKIMENIDSSVLPPSTTIFLMEAREGTKYVWDLKRQIKRWNVEQAKSLLDSGETIAVISVGDPDRALHEAINGDVEVQIVDRFDYRIKSPQQEKTVLSLVRSRR